MSPSIPALPASVSAEARTTLESLWSVRGTISMAPPTKADAAAWRAQLNDAFRAPPEVLARFENLVEPRSLGGVPVVQVTPRSRRDRTRAVLYFHGGGYTIGEPEDGLAHGLARASGLTVYSVAYRMAPEHVFPAAQDDALSVYRELVTALGADKLVVAGCSAGGGLALSMLLRAREEGLPLPAGLIGVSPWVDLTKSGDSLLLTSPLLEPLGSYESAGLGEAARAYAGGRQLDEPSLSPLFADYSAGFCPVFLSTGTRDWFLSSCAELARKLKRAASPVELSVWEGLGHAFEVMPLPESFEMHAYMGRFIRAALGTTGTHDEKEV